MAAKAFTSSNLKSIVLKNLRISLNGKNPFVATRRLLASKHQRTTRSCQIDIDGTYARVRYPGWPFGYVELLDDLKPTLKTWNVTQLMNDSRFYAILDGYLDVNQIEMTHATYVKCFDLYINEGAYDDIATRSTMYDYDIEVTSEVVYIGNTSFQIDNSIFHGTSNLQMMKHSLLMVSVNKTTGAVEPLPRWWSEKYKPLVHSAQRPLHVRFKDVKPKSGSVITELPVTIAASDTDLYGHTNYNKYVRFAMEGVIKASQQGNLTVNRNRHLLQNAFTSIEGEYIGDSLEGQTLVLHTWEDDKDPHILTSRITRGDELIYVQKLNLMKLDDATMKRNK